jgi:hypothetical protein
MADILFSLFACHNPAFNIDAPGEFREQYNGGEIRRKSFGANALRSRPQCLIQTYMMPMDQFSWGIRVKTGSVAPEQWGDLLATA